MVHKRASSIQKWYYNVILSFFRIKKYKILTVCQHLEHFFFEKKINYFFSFLPLFEEVFRFWGSHMWPEAAGASYKIFWCHKMHYPVTFELKLHANMNPPLSRPIFVHNPRF